MAISICAKRQVKRYCVLLCCITLTLPASAHDHEAGEIQHGHGVAVLGGGVAGAQRMLRKTSGSCRTATCICGIIKMLSILGTLVRRHSARVHERRKCKPRLRFIRLATQTLHGAQARQRYIAHMLPVDRIHLDAVRRVVQTHQHQMRLHWTQC